MTKGKPWPITDEKQLTDWFNTGTKDTRVLAFSFDGKYSENAIYQKLLDLGIIQKEEEAEKKGTSSSSSSSALTSGCSPSKLQMPDELPSIEEALKALAAALVSLDTPGLARTEVLRLRCIITGTKIYQGLLADYINYRGLESELLMWRTKYEALAKKVQES